MPDLRIALVQQTGSQVYYSGTTIAGNVLLSVDEPKSYKRILVQFSGRSYVHWTERHREGHHHHGHGGHGSGNHHVGSGHRHHGGHGGSGRHHSRSGHHDNQVTRSFTSSETYADLEATVWDNQQSPEGKLGAGQHSWPFRFDVPPTTPSSFEGSVGHIRYSLKAKIVTGLLKFDHNVEVPVPVQQLMKISDPRLLQPQRQEVQKTICCLCCASGPIVLTVAVPKTGFLLGESFQLNASLENGSSRQLTISANIVENATYYAQGHHCRSGKTLASVGSDEIDPQTTKNWDPTIQIPATTDVAIILESSCRNIHVVYSLNVTCQIPGAIDLSTSFPLALGNCQDQGQSTAAAAFPPTLQPGPPQMGSAAYPPPAGSTNIGWSSEPGSSYPPPNPANEKTPLIRK
jgi:hypothetical protein